MVKAVHHNTQIYVKRKIKTYSSLILSKEGTKWSKPLPRSQDYHLFLCNAWLVSSLFQNYKFNWFLYQSYDINRVSKIISEMRKLSQNGSCLQSHSLPVSLRKQMDSSDTFTLLHSYSLCSYKHWVPKFQSAWHTVSSGFIYLHYPSV